MSSAAFQTIKGLHRLPSPTGVALRILELAQNEETTVDEIAAAVESDPAIASHILKMVNSASAGMPRRIASVRRAVGLLGARAVKGLALGFSLLSGHRKGTCLAFDYDLFWSESVARAVTARHLVRGLDGFAPDEAFTCGLLCQIGRLALATAFPKRYADAILAAESDNPASLIEIERSTFSIDRNELAAEMMADWHIPEVFCEAVRAQGAPDSGNLEPDSPVCRFAHVLHLTAPIALILTQPTTYRDTLSTLANDAAGLGITPYLCHEMLDAISPEWTEVGAVLCIKTRQVPPLAQIYAQAKVRQEELFKAPAAYLSGLNEEGQSVSG